MRKAHLIEALQANINVIIARHERVRQLLDHEWLYQFQMREDQPDLFQYRGGQ